MTGPAATGPRARLPRFLPPDPRVEEPYLLTPKMALRVAVLGVVAFVVFAVLLLRLWGLQILSGSHYLDEALNNQLRTVRIEAPRGPILDREGRVLVTNVAGTAVELWPSDLPKGAGRDTELRRLSEVLRLPMAEILEKIREWRDEPLTPVTLKVAVHPDQVAYVYEHQREFRGVRIRQTYLRYYNSQALAAQLLGYVTEISPEQLKHLEGYVPGDRIGQTGVEATYDKNLRGTPGIAQLRVDSLGRPKSGLAPSEQAQPGSAIRLTIDIGLQRAAEKALGYGITLARKQKHWAANGGAIIAMNPNNGEILAMASAPTYKPGVYVGRPDREKLAPLLDAEVAREANYPGLNRAIAGLYPPGSTFKPVTALAALQEHIIGPYSSLSCTPTYEVHGFVFKNWNPYANQSMTLPTALAASCDTYFYRLGFAFYGLPADRGHPLQAWASRFGFGGPTGIDIGPESRGLLPTPEWRQATYTKKSDPCCWEQDRIWNPGDSIQLAIGQKDLQVTPLQMARFYAMIANGGKLVTPHVVVDTEWPGHLRRFEPPAPQPSGVDPTALGIVRDGLYQATHVSFGTSSAVFGSFPIQIAGKTGTAEKAVDLPGFKGLMDQSWWCGYGPVAQPSIVVCAVIENGGHGGTAAAPAALKVFEHFFGVKSPGVGSIYSD